MSAAAKFHSELTSIGFAIPADITLPAIKPRDGLRLTMEQEQAFGFSLMSLSLCQIQAMACDLDVVSTMLDAMDDAFSKDDKADKAVAMIQVQGRWLRQGAVSAELFTAYTRERIAAIRSSLTSVRSQSGSVRDLFYVEALQSLRAALSLVIPYDMILTQSFRMFTERYSDLNSACRDLVRYVSKEMHVAQPVVSSMCDQFWLSNKLATICFGANRYAQSIMPIAAKREFRAGVLQRQQRIAKAAMLSNVPVAELLGSWSSFNNLSQQVDRATGSFAMINAGLAEKVALDYRFVNDFDEVRSAAYQGLTRAITLYAPEKGLKFSTYAVTWIKQTILRSIIQQELIRLPEGSHKMLTKARAIYADMPNASDEYVCTAAGINQFELEGLRPYLQGNGAISMDSMAGDDGEDFSAHAMIADENGDFVSHLEEESAAQKIIEIAKANLDDRLFFVLKHRTGMGGAEIIGLNEMSELLQTSPQNVSRLEKKAQAALAVVPEMQEVWAAF